MPEVTRKDNNKTTNIIFKNTALHAFKIRYLTCRNHDAICKLQCSYKVHLNTINNGELSDPLCDSINRGLTLGRLHEMHSYRMNFHLCYV